MSENEWQDFSLILKKVLKLDSSPVALRCTKAEGIGKDQKKVRICRAILDAARGQSSVICKENNLCFGAAWHLGFHKIKNPKVLNMTRKFVVEGEKLFSSYEALDKMISQMEDIPDNSGNCFLLTPLEEAKDFPELILFVCNPEQACRLLTLATFNDGIMPKIKIGGPTCRMSIMYPLLTGNVNMSFYDYTARKLSNMEKDKLVISIPYEKIHQIIESLDKCSAGRAKIEYPQEFREFLQKRLTA